MNKIVLLDREIVLTPEHSKTNVYIPFRVECELSEVVFEVEYHPKNLINKQMTDEMIAECIRRYDIDTKSDLYGYAIDDITLCNLITFSLDINGIYKGSAHRHADKQTLYINCKSASPGFSPGGLHKGDWRAVICVYAVVTEECRYKLKATGTGIKGDCI
jgi:hypothetical protein